MIFKRLIYVLGLSSFIFVACQPSEKEKTKKSLPFNEEAIKNQFVKANQQLVQKESDEMDYYGKSHQMNFVKTNSGIRYFVYEPSAKGDSIKNGDEITMAYKLSLIDGTECYSSKTEGKKTFLVGQENIESGIHKAVLYLKKGDKAIILIPSHLAHGLLGDYKKIPPQMPIVYDIQID